MRLRGAKRRARKARARAARKASTSPVADSTRVGGEALGEDGADVFVVGARKSEVAVQQVAGPGGPGFPPALVQLQRGGDGVALGLAEELIAVTQVGRQWIQGGDAGQEKDSRRNRHQQQRQRGQARRHQAPHLAPTLRPSPRGVTLAGTGTANLARVRIFRRNRNRPTHRLHCPRFHHGPQFTPCVCGSTVRFPVFHPASRIT